MKKSYTVEYGPTMWECTIEVNETSGTLKKIKNMVEFWSGWEARLFSNESSYMTTFLQQLAREINYIQAANPRFGLQSVVDEFKNREGWCLMDGSAGITIEEIDDFSFEHYEYVVLPIEVRDELPGTSK